MYLELAAAIKDEFHKAIKRDENVKDGKFNWDFVSADIWIAVKHYPNSEIIQDEIDNHIDRLLKKLKWNIA